MPRSFLTPPLELLSADGVFEPLDLAPAAAWRQPQVLLARELCAFEYFEAGGVGGSAGAAAARLHARTAAPFLNPGFLIRRAGRGYGIWWWDLDRIGPWLAERFGAGARVQIAPETLAQPAGMDWRIVRLAAGFEAQFWRTGALAASSWRRQPFDAAAWSAFARQQRNPPFPAPTQPPTPQVLPPFGDLGFGLGRWRDLTAAEWARAAAMGLAAALVLACVFFTGQGLRLQGLARQAEQRAEAVRRSTPATVRGDDAAALQKLAAFRALAGRPSPLAALAAAMGVLRLYGVTAKSYTADAASLTLILPYAAIDRIDKITREMQQSGVFTDVRPLTEPENKTIKLVMTLKGGVAEDAGTPSNGPN
jgi:hypothetical protein